MNTDPYIKCRICDFMVEGLLFKCPNCGNENNCVECNIAIAFDEEYCEEHRY